MMSRLLCFIGIHKEPKGTFQAFGSVRPRNAFPVSPPCECCGKELNYLWTIKKEEENDLQS
jgi:hypothetical protein